MVKNYNKLLLKNGYFIYKIKNKKKLTKLKKLIYLNSKKILKIKDNENFFFNNFYKYEKSKKILNEFRFKIMKKINNDYFGAQCGYEIFSEIINNLFGPDIVAQKNINLVIQNPQDDTQITVHRDSPPNSLYEIVVWVPLTNTYKTKNMFILNKENTKKILNKIRKSSKKNINHKKIMNGYFNFAFDKSDKHNLKFGEALLFWAPLIHCVPKNTEKETRWSLNFRFKNMFSPYGTKGFIDYFKTSNLSSITKLALEKKKENLLDENC
jgi:sporadic carbohydrate cluster 2OG-Fe(II) oxygenase